MGSDCGDMRSAYTRTKSRDRAQSTREIETVEFQECTTLTIVRDRDAGEICSCVQRNVTPGRYRRDRGVTPAVEATSRSMALRHDLGADQRETPPAPHSNSESPLRRWLDSVQRCARPHGQAATLHDSEHDAMSAEMVLKYHPLILFLI